MAMYSISRFAQDFGAGDEADSGFTPKRMREKNFVGETSGDRTDERNHKGFHQPKTAPLQRQNDQNVECRDKDSGQ